MKNRNICLKNATKKKIGLNFKFMLFINFFYTYIIIFAKQN